MIWEKFDRFLLFLRKFDCFLCHCKWFNAHLNDLTHIWMFLRKSDCLYVNVIVFDANLNASNQILLYHSNLINCTQMWLFLTHICLFLRKCDCFWRTFDCFFYANLISGSRRWRIFGLETDGRDPAPWHARLPHSAGLGLDGAHPGRDLGGHWGQTGCRWKECK